MDLLPPNIEKLHFRPDLSEIRFGNFLILELKITTQVAKGGLQVNNLIHHSGILPAVVLRIKVRSFLGVQEIEGRECPCSDRLATATIQL